MIVALAGVCGTPIGGKLADSATRRCAASTSSLDRPLQLLHQTAALVTVIWLQISVGTLLLIICAATVGEVRSKTLFLMLLFGGVFFTFGSSAGVVRATMLLVPPHMRAFAISVQVLGIHCLGDVPSPVVVGALKDSWAPRCGIVWVNSSQQLDPRCHSSAADQDGLVRVLLCATLWMLLSVLSWGVALYLLRRDIHRHSSRPAER